MARIAVAQLCSSASILSNLRMCETLTQKAASAGAKALFLPEASDYISASASESSRLARSVDCEVFVRQLEKAAFKYNIELSVGVHEPVKDTDKVRNMQLWISEKGRVEHRYQKLHLFDVNIDGGPVIQESMGTEKGAEITPPFSSRIGTVGMLICFDMRFPEVATALRRQGAEIITFPSAFAVSTGKAHWRPLLQARAIETQTFVVAAAQSGSHNEKRSSYGHSMVIGPWGDILAELDDDPEPQIALATIDLERLKQVRMAMPLVRRK